MPDLGTLAWVALAAAAVIVGLSKAALPGANTIAVALFATALPARQSTGAILLLLIVGDAFALWLHRQHANWRALLPLIPAVLAGLVLGTVFLAFADDSWTRRVIGVLLLLVIGVTLWRRARSVKGEASDAPGRPPAGRMAATAYGALGGFTTMIANAAGPVMSMYFLAARFPMRQFLGTAAWFFAAVNLAKVPFSIGLGLITPPTLLMDLVLVPGVVIGAFIGRSLVSRMNQTLFERVVVLLTVAGALYLVV